MTTSELTTAILAICPIYGVDSNGVISFDPSATSAQQQAAQAVVVQNLTKLNGQPSRVAQDILAIFNYLTKSQANGGGGLTQGQQTMVAMACAALVLNQFPQLAAKINQATGLSIPYDQANPNG